MRQGTAANRHRRSNQPTREQLQHENERLRRELDQLRCQLAERDQQVADAAKQIADTERQIADAEKQIADLEQQLALRKQNSTNSSKPPSSEGLAGEPRPRGRPKKSRRKAGGQPGHRGAHRLCLASPLPGQQNDPKRPTGTKSRSAQSSYAIPGDSRLDRRLLFYRFTAPQECGVRVDGKSGLDAPCRPPALALYARRLLIQIPELRPHRCG